MINSASLTTHSIVIFFSQMNLVLSPECFFSHRILKLVTMSTTMIQTHSQDMIILILTDTVLDVQARLQPKLTITSVQWESLTMRALEVNCTYIYYGPFSPKAADIRSC